jgi:diacylglycerol kinase family enzyme
MRHLFIVNPVCNKVKGKLDAVISEVQTFMARYPQFNYDIHVTRWHRDALGYCRKYALKAQDETVRVHVLGGTGTLFEIVNAIVDLPNVQIASYPMGRTNIFLHYYGLDKAPLFASVEKQVFSDATGIDAIRCNHNYGISSVLIGFEAYIDNKGDKLIGKTHLPSDLCYAFAALPDLWKGTVAQNYKINLDSQSLNGRYISIMVANQPWYSENLCPGIDALPDDGVFDVYMSKDSNKFLRIIGTAEYLKGRYAKLPAYIFHYTGRKLNIFSDKLIFLSVDGETFYDNNIECELLPGAIRFVLPEGIDTDKLARADKPEAGLKS